MQLRNRNTSSLDLFANEIICEDSLATCRRVIVGFWGCLRAVTSCKIKRQLLDLNVIYSLQWVMGVVILYLAVRPGSTGDFPACVLNANIAATHVPL